MLRHAIAPSRRYTKASHDVVRHTRLTSDAKILLLAIQGLPDEQAGLPLSEHARKLGITGRAYQKSKELLVAHGYVHEWRELYLGVKEARALAGLAARWLSRGVSAGELRRVLTSELPGDGVRSAVGFLRFRLLHKMPPELPVSATAQPAAPPPVPELTVCTAPGEEHVFRPVADETECRPCGQEAARAAWRAQWEAAESQPDPLPWRERFANLGATAGA